MRNTLDRSALPRPRLLPQVQEEEGDDPDAYVDEELEEDVASEQTSGRVRAWAGCERLLLASGGTVLQYFEQRCGAHLSVC